MRRCWAVNERKAIETEGLGNRTTRKGRERARREVEAAAEKERAERAERVEAALGEDHGAGMAEQVRPGLGRVGGPLQRVRTPTDRVRGERAASGTMNCRAARRVARYPASSPP